jgi:hypothetical protein
MTSPHSPEHAISALVEAARAFHCAVEAPGSHRAAPEYLASQQEALQVLSAAWYRLAADAVARVESTRAVAADVDAPRGDLSREKEVKLIGALHDVAAAFARCARACREGESTVAPVIARRRPAGPADAGRADGDRSWFAARRRHTERVATSSVVKTRSGGRALR